MQNLWSIHFKRLSDTLESQIERSRSAVSHGTIKGTCLEVVVRDLLSKYLPRYHNVGTGQVACSNGKLTPQLDVVVYDGNAFPHLAVNEDSSVVICCECLLATVECKIGRPDKSKIKEHYDNFCKVEAQRHKLFQLKELQAGYFVLAYESFSPETSSFKDADRAIGFYSIKNDKSWLSKYGHEDFQEHSGGVLEQFFQHLLMDCMRKGQLEVGTFDNSYKVVESYLGWKQS